MTQPKKLRCIRYLNLIDIKGENLKGRSGGGEKGEFCSNGFKFFVIHFFVEKIEYSY